MILIISNKQDFSTNKIINWLISMRHDYVRINDSDNVRIIEVDVNNQDVLFEFNSLRYKLSDFSKIFIRRGVFCSIKSENLFEKSIIVERIEKYLIDENKYLINYINYIIEKKRTIGSISKAYLNKNYVLQIAKDIGLLIPKTIITNRKDRLIDFHKANNNIVLKGIQESLLVYEKDFTLTHATEKVTFKDVEKFPNSFFYTLFQEQIKKRYEIRIFYFNKVLFPMAIFSQQNDLTIIDYRKSLNGKNARMTPFILPKLITRMIFSLIDKLNVRTGSIDLIVDEKNNYYFIELNPEGEYDWVQKICNYNIDKFIAKNLINA